MSKILRTVQYNANLNFAFEIYNESLILIEDNYLLITNEVLVNLCIPTPNLTASNLFQL